MKDSKKPIPVKAPGKPKFQTHFNMEEFTWAEKNDSKGTAVPDQAMSIAEIVARSARGIPVPGAPFPIFDGEEDLYPDLKLTSKVDLELVHRQYVDELQVIQKRQQERIKKNKEAVAKKQEKDFQDAFNKWKKEQGGVDTPPIVPKQ